MDFTTDLPLCGRFNGICACVDKLTKFVKLIPDEFHQFITVAIIKRALSAPVVACLFFEHVV